MPFTRTRPLDAPPRRLHRNTKLQEVSEIQNILLAELRGDKANALAKAQVARAWQGLEELRRKMRMKPDPKPVDVSKPRLAGPPATGFAEAA